MMEIREIRALRGPNYFSRYRTIYMLLDIGEFEERPSNEIPGFVDRLKSLLPSLKKHRCSKGYKEGFFERLEKGTWLGHVVEHVALELQCLAGMEVGYGKTMGTDEEGLYKIAFRYRVEKAGLEAGEEAVRVVEEIAEGETPDMDQVIKKLKDTRDKYMLGPTTESILSEASDRDIPYIRLNDYSYFQLGYGENQKRIQASMTGETSAIAVEIADDKWRTKKILDRAGIPVPRGETVKVVEKALEVAKELGYPLAVKPNTGNHGRGISIRVEDSEELRRAFKEAKKIDPLVVIEKYLVGADHRLLVIDGELVAAARRNPPLVTGDGESTIEDLIDELNNDPKRGTGHEKILTEVEIDQTTKKVLNDKNYALDTVLPEGEKLFLKPTANLSTGGTATDVTDSVHPQNKRMAERIADIVGLDVIGIDTIALDLEKPINGNNGGVIEVNAAPGFRMHLDPQEGEKRDVGKAVVDMLFPSGSDGRIPVTAVTGTNGKTTTVRLISHILKEDDKKVGVSSTDGLFRSGELLKEGDYSGPQGAKFILKESGIDHAVLEVARGGILRRGLGFEKSEVGVFLNVANDHLGQDHINTIEDMARVKSVVVDSVKESGKAVLNAEDPNVLKYKDEVKADAILFSRDPEIEVLEEHISKGGTAVTVEEEKIVVKEGEKVMEVVDVSEIPITHGGKASFNVQNSIAAVASSFALDTDIEAIKEGLKTFESSTDQNPGRMNIMDIGDIKVMIDYSHNRPAVEALSELLDDLTDGEKIIVCQGTGNRKAEDIIDFGRGIGKTYDRVIINDADPRYRKEGETAELVEEGVLDAGVPEERIDMVLDEFESIDAGFEMAEEGDLLVVQPCEIRDVIDHIESKK
ncbi:MAG: cyanophycin synthetase [Candidatus Thermoplasmatota archaeon]